jgi:ferredoxin
MGGSIMAIKSVTISDDCTACEVCVGLCPEVFEMGEEKAVVIRCADLAGNAECIQEAIESCPVEAITIEE